MLEESRALRASHRASVERVADVTGGHTWLGNPVPSRARRAAIWILGELAMMFFEGRSLEA